MKAQRGEESYISTPSLNSALDGVGGQPHDQAAFSPLERPCTFCIGSWVGHRAGLDGCGKSHLTGIRLQDRPAIATELSRPTCIQLNCRALHASLLVYWL